MSSVPIAPSTAASSSANAPVWVCVVCGVPSSPVAGPAPCPRCGAATYDAAGRDRAFVAGAVALQASERRKRGGLIGFAGAIVLTIGLVGALGRAMANMAIMLAACAVSYLAWVGVDWVSMGPERRALGAMFRPPPFAGRVASSTPVVIVGIAVVALLDPCLHLAVTAGRRDAGREASVGVVGVSVVTLFTGRGVGEAVTARCHAAVRVTRGRIRTNRSDLSDGRRDLFEGQELRVGDAVVVVVEGVPGEGGRYPGRHNAEVKA